MDFATLNNLKQIPEQQREYAKIASTIKRNGAVFACCLNREEPCKGCYFENLGSACYDINCIKLLRGDGNDVIFLYVCDDVKAEKQRAENIGDDIEDCANIVFFEA